MMWRRRRRRRRRSRRSKTSRRSKRRSTSLRVIKELLVTHDL
jgi:hypothetical protein